VIQRDSYRRGFKVHLRTIQSFALSVPILALRLVNQTFGSGHQIDPAGAETSPAFPGSYFRSRTAAMIHDREFEHLNLQIFAPVAEDPNGTDDKNLSNLASNHYLQCHIRQVMINGRYY
jgi:hypothetical protein